METNQFNQVNVVARQRFEQNCDEFGVFDIECRGTEDARRWEDSWQEYSFNGSDIVKSNRRPEGQVASEVIKQYENELANLLAASLSADELKIGLVNFIGQHMPEVDTSGASIKM